MTGTHQGIPRHSCTDLSRLASLRSGAAPPRRRKARPPPSRGGHPTGAARGRAPPDVWRGKPRCGGCHLFGRAIRWWCVPAWCARDPGGGPGGAVRGVVERGLQTPRTGLAPFCSGGAPPPVRPAARVRDRPRVAGARRARKCCPANAAHRPTWPPALAVPPHPPSRPPRTPNQPREQDAPSTGRRGGVLPR